MKAIPSVVLVLALAVSLAAAPGESWRMKADYVEACSCHLFCPCYFNKHAEHPMCEFNMAVKVREGYSGKTNLTGAKYWLTGVVGGGVVRPVDDEGAARRARADDPEDLWPGVGRAQGARGAGEHPEHGRH